MLRFCSLYLIRLLFSYKMRIILGFTFEHKCDLCSALTRNNILGLHESVYQGMPMLCVPLFGDQLVNAEKVKVHLKYFFPTQQEEYLILTIS